MSKYYVGVRFYGDNDKGLGNKEYSYKTPFHLCPGELVVVLVGRTEKVVCVTTGTKDTTQHHSDMAGKWISRKAEKATLPKCPTACKGNIIYPGAHDAVIESASVLWDRLCVEFKTHGQHVAYNPLFRSTIKETRKELDKQEAAQIMEKILNRIDTLEDEEELQEWASKDKKIAKLLKRHNKLVK